MQAFRQPGRENHQIYPSENGISYRITGKDGKREGLPKEKQRTYKKIK